MSPTQARTLAIASALTMLPGCRVVGDIFKAGIWVGVVIVGLIVALLFGLTRAFSTR
jgi:hypothetical protein